MYKPLSEGDVTTTPYTARKKWDLTEKSPYLTFHIGANNDEAFFEDSASKNASGSYTHAVYELIRHFYYRENSDPYQQFGVIDPSKTNLSSFPDEEDGIIYVLKISNRLFGKRIRPNSFKIQSRSDQDKIVASDDGNGNLFTEKSEEQIGNVFYSNGVAVLTKPPSSVFGISEKDVNEIVNKSEEYVSFPYKRKQNRFTAFPDYEKDKFDLLFQRFELEFESVVRNFENEIAAEIKADEYGATTNPTARKEAGTPIKALEDGDFRPYVTTVGFYNDKGQLTATAKLSKPIKLPKNMPMTILARFDT